MNVPLLRRMLTTHSRVFLNYAFGSAFYIVLMFWLYPSMADNSEALDDLMNELPDGVVNAFGIQNGFGTLEAFISGEFYGLILPILLTIFAVSLATQLMARLVDRGSMAYLLSTPTTRARVALTQALVLVIGLILIAAVTTLAGFASQAWIIGDGYPLNAERFISLNVAVLALFFAIGGVAFLISSLANDEKRATGLSGAIAFGMFTLDLLGKISEKIEWLRSLSLFSLFRPSDIVSGQGAIGLELTVLFAIGLLLYAAGIYGFAKRDLPL
ncbi:ABC transporter permease subunit [Cohnella thailandensis]|uniref:ABC transporter permease subunit n=1 Tax=Cohnella thailandensis TaxID=557557 RepID=A0A841SKU6_9BACL|nr:ABC transporter permease subunit [Cohnella thailandensis]MBB6632524.1 ABC transporter permease subunit [Cohnella thailandensis]MBP1971816.1 ABC-2 type transport system permease protein [Cohnella thailandensis]